MPSVSRMVSLRSLALPLAALFVVQSLALLLPVSSYAQTTTGSASEAQTTKVTIPYGTAIDLKFEGRIAPETSPLGSSVMLTVTVPVMVNGKTVIAAGAAATGEITESSKPGAIGKPGSVGVVIKRVAAVDGTIVPLDGMKIVEGKSKQTSAIVISLLCCVLGLLQKGENAEIPAGSTIRATVATPIDVQVP